jgi:hypothetical protein
MQIKPFKDFFKEALSLSQYRELWKEIGKDYKEKYDDWFDGKWRVYLPMNNASQDPLYNEVNLKLSTLEYEIADWTGGLAKSKTSNKIQRIGKILTSAGETGLLKKFNERNNGKVAAKDDDYTVVISRHPYDIAGMSTDREWSSCKNLRDGVNKHFIPSEIDAGAMIAYVVRSEDVEKVKYSEPVQFANVECTSYGYGQLRYQLVKYDIECPEDAKEFWGSSFIARIDVDNKTCELMSVADFKAKHPTEKKLPSYNFVDIAEKYFDKSKFKKRKLDKLANPISRVLIIPVISNDDEEAALYVGEKFYGKSVKGFKSIVEDWVYDHQGFVTDPSDYHIDDEQVYDDDYNELGNAQADFAAVASDLANNWGFTITYAVGCVKGYTRRLELLDYILANSKQRSRYQKCVSVYFDEERFVDMESGNADEWKYNNVKNIWEDDVDGEIKEELYHKYVSKEDQEDVDLDDFVDNVEDHVPNFTDSLCEMYEQEDLRSRARGMQTAIEELLTDQCYSFRLNERGSDNTWVLEIDLDGEDIEHVQYALENDDWDTWREYFTGGKTIEDVYEDGYGDGVSTRDVEDYIRDQFL